MTLARLRWLAIVAPVAFVAVLYALVHTVLENLHDFPGLLVLFAWSVIGTALFSFSVFSVINRLERRVVDQNRELEQRNRELAALLAVGRASSASLELREMVEQAMQAILDVTSAEAAEVWLRDDDRLELVGYAGVASDAFAQRTSLAVGEGLPGIAAARGEAVVVHGLTRDERFVRPRVKAAGFETYCALPLRHRGETVGVLGVAARDPRKLCTDDELRLLEGVGERLGTAIANTRLHDRVLDGAVVEERVRIARELHDGLAQVLGYINTQTLAVRRLLAAGDLGAAQKQLASMERAAQRVYSDIREAIVGLRTATVRSAGIAPSLADYVAEFAAMSGIAARMDADPRTADVVLEPSTEIQLVRIVQEALSNVRKHARAEHALVRLRMGDGRLLVDVEDDGRGFDADAPLPTGWPRFGLQTMRERAAAVGGRLELDSRLGRGTVLRVSVPTTPETSDARAAR